MNLNEEFMVKWLVAIKKENETSLRKESYKTIMEIKQLKKKEIVS